MHEPLPFEVLRVIDACRHPRLTPFVKLLYRHHWMLHNGPDGAHVSAGGMALRLACSREHVEQERRSLMVMGLMVTMRGRRRTASWYPQFPASCRPPMVDQATGKGADDKVIAALGKQLAVHIERTLADCSTPVKAAKPKVTGPRLAHPSTPVAIATLLPTGVLGAGSMPSDRPTPVRQSPANGVPPSAAFLHNGVSQYAPEVGTTEVCNNLKPHKAAAQADQPRLPLMTVHEGGGSHEPEGTAVTGPLDWRQVLRDSSAGPRAASG